MGYVSIGCYVGYLLYKYQTTAIEEWPKFMKTKAAMWMALSMNLIVLVGPMLGNIASYMTNQTQTLAQIIIGASIMRLIWPIANCYLFVLLATKYKRSSFSRFAGHSFWVIFNKLGLCIYMIHWELIVLGLTLNDQSPPYGSMLDLMRSTAFVYMFGGITALIIHILFEQPMNVSLTRLIMRAK